MDSLFSFPVGLLHPLQHAGLARRTPSGPFYVQGRFLVSRQTGCGHFTCVHLFRDILCHQVPQTAQYLMIARCWWAVRT
jgi:hypothetical protein